MGFKDRIDSLLNYIVEVPGEFFATPQKSAATYRNVWGSDIINDKCPACWGKGEVTDPGIIKVAPGLVKKIPSKVVTCQLCDGTGEFDYSKASKIELAE